MPIKDAEDSTKDDFYGALQVVIDDTPRHDLTILPGNFIAQLSSERRGFELTIGHLESQHRPTTVAFHSSHFAQHTILLSRTHMINASGFIKQVGEHPVAATRMRSTSSAYPPIGDQLSMTLRPDVAQILTLTTTFLSQTINSGSNAYSHGLNRSAHSILSTFTTPQRW